MKHNKPMLIITFSAMSILIFVAFYWITVIPGPNSQWLDSIDPPTVSDEPHESTREAPTFPETEPPSHVEPFSSSDFSSDRTDNRTPAPDIEPPIEEETTYMDLYPELYCTRPEKQFFSDRTAYLTFDDGPSRRTAEVLDILLQNNVSATFFVIGNNTPYGREIMNRIVNEGHTIASHSYTHELRQIYASVRTFLHDFNRIFTLIYNTTGVKPSLFRFAGGSVNSFNHKTHKAIIREMVRRGFDYFDWNVSSGDASTKKLLPVNKIVSNVLNETHSLKHAVVLMHDAAPKSTTVEALPAIIDGLRNQGFALDKLTQEVSPRPFSFIRSYT